MRFTKAGFLPVDRQAAPAWGGGAHVDDVTLVKLDGAATPIVTNSSTFQDAAGTVTTAAQDTRGQRQARVVFPPNTTATAISLDESGGSTTALNGTLTVRATEFTIGTSRSALPRMPAPLPASSLYTYAVDFSVDEAPNAASVVFSQPVFAYLDNFLGIPTGAGIPDGFYDRNIAAWVPEDNGIVMAIVAYDAGGAAIIDLTGDAQETQADTAVWNAMPVNQRMTAGERAKLAQRYPSATAATPKSLWRVPLTHFSSHDFNHGGGVSCVANKCPAFGGELSGGYDAPSDGPCQQAGSIIDVEEQALGEELPVMGTPYTLHYKSSYSLGYLPPRGVEIDYNPGPNDLLGEFEVGLVTASGTWKRIFPAPNKNYITWDGRDSSGRRLNGSQLSTISATVVYPGDYRATGRFGDASNNTSVTTGYPVAAGVAPDVRFTRTFRKVLSAWGADSLGLGGWMLSSMHVYDPTGHILYQGDGKQRNLNSGQVVRLIAGDGSAIPRTGPATQTGIPTQSAFYSEMPLVAAAKNGDIYYLAAEPTRKQLRRIRGGDVADVVTLPSEWAGTIGAAMAFSPDGQFLYIPTLTRILRLNLVTNVVDVFAGTGVRGQSDLPMPANVAQFAEAVGVAVARDGTVYVTDQRLVRKIATDSDHTVSTVAGALSGTVPCSKGLPARNLMLAGLVTANWGVAVGNDDALWIGSGYDLIRVDPSGTSTCYPQAPSQVDAGLAVGPDNTVYFALNDWQNASTATPYSVRTLNPDGTSTVVAGGKGSGTPVDGANAVNTQVGAVRSMTVGPDGSLYFVNLDYPEVRIFQLTPPLKTAAPGCAIALPSEDGLQRFCFDQDGRHLSTRNAVTGVAQLTFSYGTTGRLSRIDDADGNATLINSSGNPVVITGPFGQTTKIYLDPTTNYATSIEDATQHETGVSHDPNGLLLSLTDRNNKVHSFAYDERGRLKRDANPASGYQVLNRTEDATGYSVTDVTALGATQSYSVSLDSQGMQTRTVKQADGSQNRSVLSPSGTSLTTLGDRRSIMTSSSIDPVTLRPYVTSTTTQYPSGLISNFGHVKSASLTAIAEKLSLNGAETSRTFNINTKTYTTTTPASATSPSGRISTRVVDVMDRATSVALPGVNPISYHYDKGRLDSVLQGSRKTELFYNAINAPSAPGRLSRVKVSDATAIISTLVVPDNAGRALSSSTCAMDASDTSCATPPIQTNFGWDAEGNLTSVTPPGKTPHGQTFQATNLLESYSPPGVSDVADPKTSFFYDRDGALDYVQQPGNRYVDYLYDPATRQLLSDGNASFTYYPAGASCPGCTPGKLKTAQTNVALQTFSYDGPLLTGQTTAWSNATSSVTRAYNPQLAIKSENVAWPMGGGATSSNTATYGYDVDGLLTCASLSDCSATASNKLTLSYAATTGALTVTQLGVLSDSYTYNSYGERATYSAKVGSGPPFYSITYDGITSNTRDGFGRVKRETDAVGVSRDYVYDEQGRLSKVSQGGALLRWYTYDSNGNRLSTSPLSPSPIAQFDGQDRLLSYSGSTYGYGPNGELRSRTAASTGGVDEFAYTPLGYLSNVLLANGNQISYGYDGLGRRIQRTRNSTTTRYIYRDGLSPVAVLDGAGTLLARFVYASRANVPDFMVLASGAVFRIISDPLGSPRFVVNSTTGEVVQSFDYDEFGNRSWLSNKNAFPDAAQPFGFAGGLFDEDTGLVHFGARDYDPAVGRWISKDPIRFGGRQANLYVYVGNDPINRTGSERGTRDAISAWFLEPHAGVSIAGQEPHSGRGAAGSARAARGISRERSRAFQWLAGCADF